MALLISLLVFFAIIWLLASLLSGAAATLPGGVLGLLVVLLVLYALTR